MTKAESRRLKQEWIPLERIALLAAAVVLGILLFVPPFVGIADNGDFSRIMGTVGLEYPDPDEPEADRFFRYAHADYTLRGPGIGGYVSSEIPVVLAATLLNRLLHSQHLFDIRFLGIVYAVLFLLAMHSLLKACRSAPVWTRALFAMLLIFVFCDIGYAAYYHSLFGEPVSLVFLLLTVGLGLRLAVSADRPTAPLLVGFFLSAAFLAAAKVQTAPVGLVLALLALRFRTLRSDRLWRRTWGWGTAGLILISAAIYMSAPKELKAINEYQTVFNGVLHKSAAPEQDLAALGLPPQLAKLTGTNYFMPNLPLSPQDPQMQTMFYSRISHGRIAWFYLSHPRRLFDNLRTVADNAMMIRPYYLGNYQKSADFAQGAMSMKFSAWSEWKKNALPHSLPFFGILAAAYAAALFRFWRKAETKGRKLAAETGFAVLLIAALSFVTPLIGDGVTDIGKHLFLFNALFDLLGIGAVTYTIHACVSWIAGKLASGNRTGLADNPIS